MQVPARGNQRERQPRPTVCQRQRLVAEGQWADGGCSASVRGASVPRRGSPTSAQRRRCALEARRSTRRAPRRRVPVGSEAKQGGGFAGGLLPVGVEGAGRGGAEHEAGVVALVAQRPRRASAVGFQTGSKGRPTGTLAPQPRAPSHVFVAESSCGTPAMRRGPLRLSGPKRPATRPARRWQAPRSFRRRRS